MATKEQREKMAIALATFMEAAKLAGPYRLDYGQQGVRVEFADGELPFGSNRYTPTEFMAALQFATTVAIKEKK